MIYPVLRELRHPANRLLRERGFPDLFKWLRDVQGSSLGLTVRWLELVFSPADESLLSRSGGVHKSSRV